MSKIPLFYASSEVPLFHGTPVVADRRHATGDDVGVLAEPHAPPPPIRAAMGP